MFDFLRELFGLKPRRRRHRTAGANDVLIATIHQRANSARHPPTQPTPPPMPPMVPRNRVAEVPSPIPPPNPRQDARRSSRRQSDAIGPAIDAALEATLRETLRFLRWSIRTLLRLLFWTVVIGVPAAAVIVPSWLMIREVQGVGVEVGTISVPKSLADRGIDANVLAARLADRVAGAYRATLADPTDRPGNELTGIPLNITVSATSGVWHRSALLLRDLFDLRTTRLDGELTEDTDGKLALRLRVPGFGQVADLHGYADTALDSMLDDAAPEVWQVAQPKVYAWHSMQTIYKQDLLWSHLEALRNTGRLDSTSNNTVSFLLIKVLLNGSRAEDALEFANNLVARAPNYAPGWYVKALAELANNHGQAAVDAGQKMIELDGGSVWGRKATARLFMTSGRFNEAFREVRSALRINPEDIDGMILESSLHSVLGRADEGIAAARRAVEFMPTQPGVHEVLANALMGKKAYAAALEQLNIEIANHPARISTRVLRANVLLTMSRPAEALKDAELVLKDTPNSGQALMIRGWALLALGRPQESKDIMDILLGAHIFTPGVLQTEGLALEALGQRDAGLVYINRALQQAPNNALYLEDRRRMSSPAQ